MNWLKKITIYFLKTKETISPGLDTSQKIKFFVLLSVDGGRKRRRDKRDHLKRWLSTYTMKRKEWSGRTQTQVNDSVSFYFSWTCPLNSWKETQHMNKQRWRGRVWSESSSDTGSRRGRWGMARMVTNEMKKQWKKRGGGWNINSPCHPPFWELYEGQADVKEKKEKAKKKKKRNNLITCNKNS